ncbi:MAG: protein kinase [Planctomycetes bacterium]|nr:protein kinase [Planctomycetota bacterium]
MNCPSHNEIRDALKGKLQATEIEQLYEHLEDCSACRSLVDDAEEDADDLLSALRDESGKVVSDESYRRMVRSAEQAGTARLRASLSQSKSSAPQRIRDYDLLESIGKGGMGTLYRAVHSRLKRQVAVKMISERLMNNSDAVTRFMREMEAVGKLEHENIVRALDAGDQEGLLYLVMELVEGLDAGQILNRTNAIAVADACEIARQAAEGLHYAHRKGLVHRDVKPSNLMITDDGCVKVLDMGLALLTSDVDDKSANHGAVGSVDYVSPEQVKNSQTVDGKADIYSLGCTLFHLLAGTPPHRANKKLTVAQRLQAHVTEKVDPVNLWRTEVPSPLAELVSSMLSKSPDDRPRDAAAVANALVPYTKAADLVALVRTARKKSSVEEETPSSQISTATPSRAKPLNADDSSTQQDQLTIEFQREMLRDFGHLAHERTQAAQDIQHRFAAHMSELEGGYDTERNRTVSKFESQIQPLQTEYRTRRESATSKYESDSYELVQLEEEFIDEASMHHTVEMEDAKQEIEVAKQNVLDNFKAAHPVPQQKLERFGHQQAERTKQIDEFKKKTRSILQRRGCLSDIEPETVESTTTKGDVATCLKRFASEVALATLRLQEVYNRPAARYLEEGWGWLLMIFAFIAAIVPCGIVFEWTNWLLWLPASLGIGIVVGVSVRQIVRPIGRRQTLEVFPPLQQAIAEAEAALDGALTAAQAEAKKQERNLVAIRDQQLTAIDQNWAKTRESMVAHYTHQKQKKLLEFQATRKSLDENHECQIAEFEQTYPPKIELLQRQFAEGTEQLDQQVSQRRQKIKTGFDREWHQLAARWSEGAAKFETAVDEMNRACDESCPPWSTIDADTWTPPINSFQATSAIRFGHYDYVVNSIERATDNVTFQQTRASFALPGVLSFPARPSLLLKSEDDGRDVAAATLQNVMLRMLTVFPPAKVRFTIIDPTGLGQNFSMFMHLTDFDERLVSSRIWTEATHINQRLTDLTEHMENVIQKYLRNEFASIQEYNEHAGEVAEPFQVLVVANFPANFSDEAARRLVSIANSGARCGVFTLISTDRKLKMPRNFDLTDLESHAATLNWRDRRFWHRYHGQ